MEARQWHSRDLRKGRHSVPGQIYLVTMATNHRKPIFSDMWQARCAVCCLYDSDVARQTNTMAYVVMPDHVHWLFQLTENGQLSEAVRLYKAKVSYGLKQRIWQRGFHDRALRAQENIVEVSRYIVANPIRAGLVGHIGDYPHWDAIWLTGA